MARSPACSASTISNTRPDGDHAGHADVQEPVEEELRAAARRWPGTRAATRRSTVKAGYGLFYQPLTTSFYRGTTFRIYPYFAGVDIRQPPVFGPGNIAVLAAGVSPELGAEAIRVHLLRREAAVHGAVARRTSSATSATAWSRKSATRIEGAQPAVLRRPEHTSVGLRRRRREAAGARRDAALSELGPHPHAHQRSPVHLPRA